MFELTVFFNIEKIGVVFKTWSKLRIKWNFELTVFELAVPDLYQYNNNATGTGGSSWVKGAGGVGKKHEI